MYSHAHLERGRQWADCVLILIEVVQLEDRNGPQTVTRKCGSVLAKSHGVPAEASAPEPPEIAEERSSSPMLEKVLTQVPWLRNSSTIFLWCDIACSGPLDQRQHLLP